MSQISINLLPIEFKEQELKRTKFYKIQALGIGIVMLMVFLSSLTVALRILQSQNISQIQKKVAASEQKVSDYKTTQGSLILLKDRLTAISQYLGNPSKQSQSYKLISELLPPTISIGSVSIGKEGEILLFVATKDSNSMDTFITNLTSKEKNQDKISQVSLDTLSRGRDGIYKASFKIKTK